MHAVGSRKVADAESQTDYWMHVGLEHSLRLSATLQNILAKSRMSLCQIRLTSPCCLKNNYSSVCRDYSRLSRSYYIDGCKRCGIMELGLRLCLACLLNCSETMRHWRTHYMVQYCGLNNSVSTPPAMQKLLKLETCKWVSKCSKQAMAHVGLSLILAGLRCR